MRTRHRLTLILIAPLLAAMACGSDAPRAEGPVDTAVARQLERFESVRGEGALRLPPGPESFEGLPDTLLATGPTVVLRADSAAGDSLYHRRARCFTCHGPSGAGIANLGPNLADGEWLHGDGSLLFIASVIRNGVLPMEARIVMPPFAADLTEEEIFRIAGYVYSLSNPWAVAADTAAGTTAPESDVPRD